MSCAICDGDTDDPSLVVSLTEKGLVGVLNACRARGNLKLVEVIEFRKKKSERIIVHKSCRKEITDLRKIKVDEKPPPAKKTRSSIEPFHWSTCCLFCGSQCFERDKKQVCEVTTNSFRQSILDVCLSRLDDPYSAAIAHRIQNCSDIAAVKAKYHKVCSSKFYKLKQSIDTGDADEKPFSQVDEEKRKPGKPKDVIASNAFQKTCNWLESTAEPLLLSEVETYMATFANIDGESHMWGRRYLKDQLQKKFGDHIEISSDGYNLVIRLKDMAKRVINDKWYQDRKPNLDEEKNRIILAAAKIIKEEIREMKYDKSYYPDEESIANVSEGKKWIPKSLNTFLENIIESEVKQNSIGQCLVQAIRPKSAILPIPFGVGIEMDHVFGSRWHTNQLSDLGFSITYDEVIRYKQSVLQGGRIECFIPRRCFTQWAGDNADHCTRTLDGKNTFHGMGTIAITSSVSNNTVAPLPLVKRMVRIPVNDLTRDKGIPVVPFIGPPKAGLSDFVFEPRETIPQRSVLLKKQHSNSLWQIGWTFASETRNHPNWLGFMQNIKGNNDSIIEKSDVFLLPLLDEDPTTETCIYSTLLNISKQARILEIPTASVTFDQPLWLKAAGIVKAKGMDIVCRLGGFHTLMSFLGSIGTVMDGSGIESALGEVYGENVIQHLMSGKAYARSLRGHFLLEAALTQKLIDGFYQDLPEADVKELDKILSNVIAGQCGYDKIEESEAIKSYERKLEEWKNKLASQSRTAKLWIKYLDYINVVKVFITAERTGDWPLHLVAIERMLNLFAATGHIHYAKSARLYLQQMNELKTRYPWLYQKFLEGYHPVRRTKRYWSGLWTDLAIEQMLMGLMKGRSGLTRGRGLNESVRHVWIHSMHRCTSVHNAMTTFTGRERKSSEQHVDMTKSRRQRDYTDMMKIRAWLDQHEPFDENVPGLRSLSTGLTAKDGDGVNCDRAEEVGLAIHKKMDNLVFTDAKISRSDHVKPLAYLYSNVKIDKKSIYINPLTLFTRLIAIVQREEHIEKYFSYEMATLPISLFKDGLMRKADKPALRKYLVDSKVEESESNGKIVLDGGALLRRVRWKKGETYEQTFQRYNTHIERQYGKSTIVFDGYKPSIKDHEHQRRGSLEKTSADIKVISANKAHGKQDAFLTNTYNKEQFIHLLSEHLRKSGHSVINCDDDADTIIAETAIKLANFEPVTVIADDADVLFMLIHHFEDSMSDVYFKSNKIEKCWNVRDIVRSVGPLIKSFILFVHAWLGCDTTSAIYDQGKTNLIKKMVKSAKLRELCTVVADPQASENEVVEAGRVIFLMMYGAPPTGSLTNLR